MTKPDQRPDILTVFRLGLKMTIDILAKRHKDEDNFSEQRMYSRDTPITFSTIRENLRDNIYNKKCMYNKITLHKRLHNQINHV